MTIETARESIYRHYADLYIDNFGGDGFWKKIKHRFHEVSVHKNESIISFIRKGDFDDILLSVIDFSGLLERR